MPEEEVPQRSRLQRMLDLRSRMQRVKNRKVQQVTASEYEVMEAKQLEAMAAIAPELEVVETKLQAYDAIAEEIDTKLRQAKQKADEVLAKGPKIQAQKAEFELDVPKMAYYARQVTFGIVVGYVLVTSFGHFKTAKGFQLYRRALQEKRMNDAYAIKMEFELPTYMFKPEEDAVSREAAKGLAVLLAPAALAGTWYAVKSKFLSPRELPKFK